MKGLNLLKIKRGDTRNGIHATLKKDGTPVDLTDLSVKIHISNGVESFVQILNAEQGEVFYPFEATAVEMTGFFKYEFKVIYEDERIESFPNCGQLSLRICESLGGN